MATDPRERIGEFAAYLREHGFALGFSEVELMARVAALLPLSQWRKISLLWRGIAAGSVRQWQKYMDLHQAFWFPHRVRGSTRASGLTRRGRTLPELIQQLKESPSAAGVPGHAQGVAGTQATDEVAQQAQGGASRAEALDERDFSEWTPEDVDRFEPVIQAFQRQLRVRLLRRWEASRGSEVLHLRRSVHAALGTGGELIRLRFVRRRRHQPKIVLLVDVSRSMQTHAHFFLRLARAFVEVMNARSFVFHTRLAEISPLLKRRSGRVQEKINAVTFGFGGGTRIASCLAEAFSKHLSNELGRGDLVLVFSDGFDTDEPEDLGRCLARIRSRGPRLYWLHPTREPPASVAMQAARRYVSGFIPAHNLASLSRLPQMLSSA